MKTRLRNLSGVKNTSTRIIRTTDPIPEWLFIMPYDSTNRKTQKRARYKAWCAVRGLSYDPAVLEKEFIDHYEPKI